MRALAGCKRKIKRSFRQDSERKDSRSRSLDELMILGEMKMRGREATDEFRAEREGTCRLGIRLPEALTRLSRSFESEAWPLGKKRRRDETRT